VGEEKYMEGYIYRKDDKERERQRRWIDRKR
jgi:hypothetical protein